MILFKLQENIWVNLCQVLEVSLVPNTKTRCRILMVTDRTYQVNETLEDLVNRMSVAADAAALS